MNKETRQTAAAARHADPTPAELKGRTVRGALASATGQSISLALRVVSMVALARLLAPADFGLVGMATAITGFMALFKDAGLSDAAVQSHSVTQEQLSVLFWINVAVGLGLGVACAMGSTAVAAFYGEPRLVWIMLAMGTSFVLTGLTAQHRAALLRNLRIKSLALVEVFSLATSIVVSIVMAAGGYGYWALVAGPIALAACSCAGMWIASGWIPSWPRRNSGARRMIIYGGSVTLNSLIVYVAYNLDKVLLGRYWGAEVLGTYGRAYQLLNMPVDSLHTTMGSVAFPALARVQREPEKLRSYFLGIYRLFLSITMPIAVACALFAEDIIRVFLGPQWSGAVPVFRLLAPTMISFALINPFGWLMFATGRMKRSIKLALLIAVGTIVSYVIGLRYGGKGVALGFSIAMALLTVPVIVLSRMNTLITVRDALRAVAYPASAAALGAAAALVLSPWIRGVEPVLVRLILANSVLFGVYLGVLLIGLGQGRMYAELLAGVGIWPRGPRSAVNHE